MDTYPSAVIIVVKNKNKHLTKHKSVKKEFEIAFSQRHENLVVDLKFHD